MPYTKDTVASLLNKQQEKTIKKVLEHVKKTTGQHIKFTEVMKAIKGDSVIPLPKPDYVQKPASDFKNLLKEVAQNSVQLGGVLKTDMAPRVNLDEKGRNRVQTIILKFGESIEKLKDVLPKIA